MISIRYHLFTLVAVFLALAIGLVAGSTVIQQSLVDQLEGNLDRLEAVNDDVEQRNGELSEAVERHREIERGLAEQGPAQLLQGRLAGATVVMLGVDGVPESSVDDLRDTIATAGATIIGPIWLRERLLLVEDDEVEELAEILGVGPTSAPILQAELAERLGGMLAVVSSARLNADERERRDVSVEAAVGSGLRLLDLLEQLEEARFIDVDDGLEGLRGSSFVGTRVVIVAGPGAKLDDAALAVPIVERLTRGNEPVAVAVEAPPPVDEPPPAEGPQPGQFVGVVRGDRRLRNQLSTVDDGGMFVGWAATVLALDDLGRGRVGHYGIGDGAERLLPAPADS